MSLTISPKYFDAVILDMDGVVTDTIPLHRQAWCHVLDQVLAERGLCSGEDHRPVSDEDYRSFAQGRSCYDGVAELLAARGVVIRWGTPGDLEPSDTLCGLGNRQDDDFLQLVQHRGAQVFAGTIAFVRACRLAGLGTAVVLASRNGSAVLAAGGLESLFDIQLDPASGDRQASSGNSSSAVHVEAARQLAVTPARAIVVTASESGADAARRGGFALVLGIDRTGDCAGLLARGADQVVTDLNEVRVVSRVDVTQRAAIPRWMGYACGRCCYCVSGWETLCEAQRSPGYAIDADSAPAPTHA
jgi:alpha,alpha-trehalase